MTKKKSLFVALASVMLATSCSTDDLQSGGAWSKSQIGVNPTIGKLVARASETTTANLSAFKTFSFLTDDSKNYMDGVTYSNASGEWTTDAGTFYWPVTGDLNFYSYAPENPGSEGEVKVNPTEQKITGFVPYTTAATQQDFIYSKATGNLASNGTTGIDLNFEHALSEITVYAKNDNSAYTVEVSGVKLGNITSKGDFTFPTIAGDAASWILGSEKADYTTEWESATTLTSTVSSLHASNTAFMLLPQQLEAVTKAKDGNYIALKVKITMQGGQVIHDGWAYVAIPTLWEMGKHYAYTLDFTSGAGQDEDGNDIISGSDVTLKVNVTPWDEENNEINWNKYIYGNTISTNVWFYLNDEFVLIQNVQDGKWKYDVTNKTFNDFDFSTLFNNGTTTLHLANLDISGCTNMSNKFNSPKIESLELSGWNTSNVTDMRGMFQHCNSLTSLELSGWNTSNVTDMSNMFYQCNSLTSLELSRWNTSNVTDMSNMFYQCNSLTSLELSGWNTSNVTDMSQMFRECRLLTSLDLSKWKVYKVKDFSYMFYLCLKLKNLNVAGWDLSNIEDDGYSSFNYTFYDLKDLECLDMTGWKLNDKMKFGHIIQFTGGKIILKNCDFGKRTSLASIFAQCQGMNELDVSGWNTSKVTDMSSAFEWCSKLQSLDLSGWNTSKVMNMSCMFNHCSSLETIDLSGWNLEKLNKMDGMFSSCPKLKTIYMIGCNEQTINKIKEALAISSGLPTDIIKTSRD